MVIAERERVVIFGCGGLGQLVRDILLQSGTAEPVAFLDSDAEKHGRLVDDLPVCGGLEEAADLARDAGVSFMVAIGENRARVETATRIQALGGRLTSAIHPLSSISPRAQIGEHLIVGARVTVCVNSRIGSHTILSAGSIVDHDTSVGSGVHIHPAVRVAGGVTIDDFVTLEIGSSVIPDLRLAEGAHVSAGSIVIRHVAAGEFVSGMPARTIHTAPSPAAALVP